MFTSAGMRENVLTLAVCSTHEELYNWANWDSVATQGRPVEGRLSLFLSHRHLGSCFSEAG